MELVSRLDLSVVQLVDQASMASSRMPPTTLIMGSCHLAGSDETCRLSLVWSGRRCRALLRADNVWGLKLMLVQR